MKLCPALRKMKLWGDNEAHEKYIESSTKLLLSYDRDRMLVSICRIRLGPTTSIIRMIFRDRYDDGMKVFGGNLTVQESGANLPRSTRIVLLLQAVPLYGEESRHQSTSKTRQIGVPGRYCCQFPLRVDVCECSDYSKTWQPYVLL